MRGVRTAVFVCLALFVTVPVLVAADFPAPVDGDYVARDFKFGSGDTLPSLKLHYRTIGTPQRDASGVVRNAVMILHGTGGTGGAFLSQTFGGELFGAGQVLDATRYFIILPDGIGHGKSSKPSDGMHARFPQYTYDDMVRAQHTMLVDGLKVNHLRLVLGTSMAPCTAGCGARCIPTSSTASCRSPARRRRLP